MSNSDDDETKPTAPQDDISFSDDDDDVPDIKTTKLNNNSNQIDNNDEKNGSVVANEDEDDFDEVQLLRDDDDEDEKEKDSEEEPEDDDDLDKDSDEEEERDKGKSKPKRKLSQDKKKKSKKRKGPMTVSNFFLGEADVASDDDEEEPEYEERGTRQEEEILDRDEQAARDAIDARHEANRKRHVQSAEDIAAEIEERHKQDTRMKKRYAAERGDGGGGIIGNVQVAQQSFLPSVLDPKIFKVKCKPGNELILLRAVMLKTIDVRNKGGLLKIKSAFISDAKGFVYIEAINEAFAKEIINGLRMLYPSSFEQIPVPEMTSVLTVTIKKKPLKMNQWVRLKRGPLKGDLARIVDLFEGGSKAFIQAVPRPDYTVSVGALDGASKKTVNPATKGNAKIRPQQRLFDPEEAKSHQATVLRRHHPLSNAQHSFDVWNNEYYRDGFMFKEVTAATYIDECNVNPRLEELQLFRPRKTRRDGDDDEDADDMESTVTGGANNQSFIKELAEQIAHMGEEDDKAEGVNPFVPGDLVQVTGGDLRNLVARITAVNDMARVATIVPYNNDLTQSFNVEVDLLVKYIFPGAHVKVVAGRYMGQTGRVVSVNSIDGDFVAAILTDGINTEIQCNVSHLQMSSEVTTGHGNLLGYELYDLVSLSENETAIVVMVGAEKLRVMNQHSNIKEVMPQEVQGKRNFQSAKNNGFDSQQNTIGVNDTVRVVSGDYVKQTGTIKHMMKGSLWLHSNTHLKNSGIFVVKQRQCVVAGGKSATPILSASYRGVLTPTPTHPLSGGGLGSNQSTPNSQQSRTPNGPAGGGYKIGRDPSIGITIMITKNKYKGMLGTVVDVTPTHYSVELSAKMKRIVIERNLTKPVGDKSGSFVSEKRAVNVGGSMEVPSTPYLTSQTPMHYAGSETPRFAQGNETPMYGSETPSRTPRAGDDFQDVWKVSAADLHTQQSPQTMTPLSANSGGQNPWNLQNGYGSGISNNRPLDQYSPANSSSNYSMAGTPLNGSSGAAPFKDFDQDMVALLRKGQYTGKMCVVQQRTDHSGMVQVSLRRSDGSMERNTFAVFFEDLVLAEPAKRENAVVVSGKHKGRSGVVKNIIGKDVILDLGSGPQEMFKMASVAWLNNRR